jgi:hypothetical protein
MLLRATIVWMRRLPRIHSILHGALLVDGDMLTDALPVGGIFSLVRAGSQSREAQPIVGLNVVLLNSHPDGVQQAQGSLRAGIALVRSLAVPVGRLEHVAGHAAAIAIKIAQMNLGWNVALICGLAVPIGCLPIVRCQLARFARRAGACGVSFADLDLSSGVSAIGFGQQSRIDGRGLRTGRLRWYEKRRNEHERQYQVTAGSSGQEIHECLGCSVVGYKFTQPVIAVREPVTRSPEQEAHPACKSS